VTAYDSNSVLLSSPSKPSFASNWAFEARQAEEEKRIYQDKLETADSSEIFKYVFLINNATVEKYVQQAREQAEVAFRLSRIVALSGFVLFAVSVISGVISQVMDTPITIAVLAGIGGLLTELIAAVFFSIYNRTLLQINRFYEGLMTAQHETLLSKTETMGSGSHEPHWTGSLASIGSDGGAEPGT
jgi:hypothetical protein